MKVLYLDHEAVRFFSDCVDGVQLQCRSDAHVPNCTISKPVEAYGMPATPSIPPQRTSPPATDSPQLPSTTEGLQSSSIAQTKDGMQEKGQSCSSEASRTHYTCGEVGGVLGVAIGILAIVVVGLLIGWIHHHRNSKRYK